MFKKTKSVVSVKCLLNLNLKLPKKDQSIFTLEDNGDSIFDFLLLISNIEKVENCEICAYRIAKRDCSFLEELIIQKKLPITNLLLSDSIKRMTPVVFNYVKNNPSFNINFKSTHAKYALLKTENNYYCIFSSGNFNPHSKVEQLNIINNKSVYEFFLKNNCNEKNN